MSDAKTTAISGCVIWFLLISVISSCVIPVFFVAGSLSSFSMTAINITGGWLCPEGTTPQQNTYTTTTFDEYNNPEPATAYELQCVDVNGEVVKTDPVFYSFIWIGIFALIGAIVSGVSTFIFAVPGGMLVTKVLNSLRSRRLGISKTY